MDGGADRNQPYRGRVGQTRRERIQYTSLDGTMVPVDVYRVVNGSTHPELGAKLAQGSLNLVDVAGETVPVHVSVLYHNPDKRLCVLVVSPTARHTELDERRRVLEALAVEADEPVPRYVRDFGVAFGAEGLARLLEGKADRELHERRITDLERQLAARTAELDKRTSELARQTAELRHRDDTLRDREATVAEQGAELSRLQARIEELSRDVEQKGRKLERRITAVGEQAALAARAPDGDPDGTPLPHPVAHEDIETHPFELMSERERAELGIDRDEAEAIRKAPTPGRVRTGSATAAAAEETTAVTNAADVALERWIVARDPLLKVQGADGVQFAVSAEPDMLEALVGTSRPATSADSAVAGEGGLDVRLQLHRMPTYPVVVLSIAGSARPTNRVDIDFNVADDRDRGILRSLADDGRFQLDLFDAEYLLVKTRRLSVELGDNVRYVVASADEHLNSIGPADRSFSRARRAWQDPAYDRYGDRDPRRERYESANLDELSSPAAVAAALAVASEFSRPADEAFLLLVVGESVAQWTNRQRRVALRAVELGLWPGTELARVAIAEGAARTPRDLVARLRTAFAANAAAIPAPLVEGNGRALEREARRLGLDDSGRARSSADAEPGAATRVASGTIEGVRSPTSSGVTPAPVGGEGRRSAATVPFDGLLERLADKDARRDAALELCRRADARALKPLFGAVEHMTRAEAVSVLGQSVAFGQPAAPHLIEGLRSRKGFVRHGCALALAMLRHGDGIEKICDLLLAEPTDVWREVARAVGHVGAPAVMSLIARLRNLDDERRGRVAWALANIAARGARGPVETLAQGRDPEAAAVAIRALELEPDARKDDAQVHGRVPVRDQTVNRAFSRKFFEAMNAAESGEDVLALDESDLIEAEAEDRTSL